MSDQKTKTKAETVDFLELDSMDHRFETEGGGYVDLRKSEAVSGGRKVLMRPVQGAMVLTVHRDDAMRQLLAWTQQGMTLRVVPAIGGGEALTDEPKDGAST